MTLISSYDAMTLRDPAISTELKNQRFSTRWLEELSVDVGQIFGRGFSIWDPEAGECVQTYANEPVGDEFFRAGMATVVGSRNQPQFIADENGILLLAIPFDFSTKRHCVAMAAFATRRFTENENLSGACQLLGLELAATLEWMDVQTLWSSDSLLRLASVTIAKRNAEANAKRSKAEVETIADNLASTYEEITLIHGLTQNLRISSSDETTGRFALQSLIGSLPIEGAAIQLLPVSEPGKATYKARTESMLVTEGKVPITNEQFSQLIAHLDLVAGSGPLVVNFTITGSAEWPFPEIRQLIIVPLAEGTNLFGWLAAFNHISNKEFHTVEASLLSSVGVMLGIHSGNRELYRRQAELLAGVVQALTSAIDAKDPYTCGHSDRVGRIAVRLAKELGKDAEYLHTIYMAGLLHDVGKIGIDENVLRKAGSLTSVEYEHIKLHPALGHRILADIQELKDVLPAVLHHHEQWDGRGYPEKLSGDAIPEIARIMAVADAYDAMFSSRPYRPGMPEEKVESILREGAGKQWDADVIEAYFNAREDIREIGSNERASLTLDVQQWV